VVLLSAGMAVAVSPLTTAVMNSAPDGQSGAASGINNAASRVAGLLAVAVLGALAEHVFRRGAPGGSFGALASAGETAPAAMQAAFLAAYSISMAVAGCWAAIAAITAFVSLREADPARAQSL